MMTALWAGRLPLPTAFWIYALLYGTAANLVATAVKLGLIVAGLPAMLALCVALLPLPYVVAATVGVMRSAGHYDGSPLLARAAEAAVIVWALLMLVV